jgi:hypothetical protein
MMRARAPDLVAAALMAFAALTPAPPAPAQGPAAADPVEAHALVLSLPAKVTGPAGQPIHVAASSTATLYVWLPGSEGLDVFRPGPGVQQAQCAVRAAKPGTYRLWCVAALGQRYSTGTVSVVVGDGPPPPPTPPPPPPPVAVGKLWLVIVETPSGAAGRGKLLADPALQALVKARGHRLRVVDADVRGPDGNPPADVAPYLDRAAGKTLPQLFIVTEAGAVLFAGALPETGAALAELVKAKGG